VLISGDNQSATTGVVNATLVRSGGSENQRNETLGAGDVIVGGTPYYSPPNTSLAFYSYGATPQPYCPSSDQGVVGALWVTVPVNFDGSYNMAKLTIYFTPGVFPNGTAISR
jgi:hypothetical protein